MRYINSTQSFLFLFLILVAVGANADKPQFSVTGFIPEKFTDLQLYVMGGCNLTGNDNSNDLIERESNYSSGHYSDRDNDQLRADFQSRLNARYETVPGFFKSSSNLRLYLNNSDNVSSEKMDREIDRYDVNTRDSESSNFNINFGQDLDVGVYVAGDFFGSLIADLNLGYQEGSGSGTALDSTVSPLPNEITRYYTDRESTDTDNSLRRYSIDAAIMLGYGRSYDGVYAATAMYMIEELKKTGYIKNTPSYNQMIELSNIIYQSRLQFYTDRRIHRIKTLTAIGDYLLTTGLVEDMNISGQVILQDVWDYFPRFARNFGFRVRAGIGYEFSYIKEWDSRDRLNQYLYTEVDANAPDVIDTTSSHYSEYHTVNYLQIENNDPYLIFLIEYFRPLDLRWQVDLTARARYYINSDWVENSYNYNQPYGTDPYVSRMEFDHNDYYNLSFNVLTRYIPSSRTMLSFSGEYNRTHYRREVEYIESGYRNIDTSYVEPTVNNWSLDLSSKLSYRISIPTTLSCGFGYSFGSRQSKNGISYYDNDYGNYSFGISLSHYLF